MFDWRVGIHVPKFPNVWSKDMRISVEDDQKESYVPICAIPSSVGVGGESQTPISRALPVTQI